jgi:hypothetical protein
MSSLAYVGHTQPTTVQYWARSGPMRRTFRYAISSLMFGQRIRIVTVFLDTSDIQMRYLHMQPPIFTYIPVLGDAFELWGPLTYTKLAVMLA